MGMTLRPSERRMLARLTKGPEQSPTDRASVTAWHRTADSLERRGLVTTIRTSESWTATRTR